ncbi:hypothetical protein RR42_m0467 [Cupriavidus basilensis]|uniref:Uncharacterized protein n=1 Tax=Cupriavidus basilensis TaxID=68895 RepID=A0A0C4Y4L9_9BURK|nr:hypothetical protein RR42_m0467 [Cupriavidus basilensis]
MRCKGRTAVRTTEPTERTAKALTPVCPAACRAAGLAG